MLPPIVDRTRPDARFASGARTILVQLWYPTEARRGQRSTYFVDPAILDAEKAGSKAPSVVETWRSLKTHAILNAPISRGPFPLILFSHGFGIPRAQYTAWIEELASRGFVVAAIDHPFSGLTRIDGRLFETIPDPKGPEGKIREIATDIVHVLPVVLREPGISLYHVAAIGHSIGGTAAIESCALDARIEACINLDGDSFGQLTTDIGKPFMVIHQQPVFPDARPGGDLARMGREIDAAWRNVISKQSRPVRRLSVRGTGHLSFSDTPFLRPELVADGGGILTDPLLVLRGTTCVIVDYLHHVFARKPDATLNLPEFIGPPHMGSPL